MVRQALREEPITVYGDGTQSRCFGHVSDVVGALMALAEHEQSVGEVFNVGNDGEITIGELAQRIKRMTSSPSKIEFIPYEQAYEAGFEDMLRRVPDLTKLRSLISYEPQYDTDRILESVIGYEMEKMTRRHIPAVHFGAHV
jgi:UDP-glucose 4-epimerase